MVTTRDPLQTGNGNARRAFTSGAFDRRHDSRRGNSSIASASIGEAPGEPTGIYGPNGRFTPTAIIEAVDTVVVDGGRSPRPVRDGSSQHPAPSSSQGWQRGSQPWLRLPLSEAALRVGSLIHLPDGGQTHGGPASSLSLDRDEAGETASGSCSRDDIEGRAQRPRPHAGAAGDLRDSGGHYA